MPIRVKVNSTALTNGSYGGGWADLRDGYLRVKIGGVGGGYWHNASNCYIKYGGVGTGWWYDSGYRGYPNPPQGIFVNSWDFNNVEIAFYGATDGGAPVAYYQIQMQDADGGYYTQVDVGGGTYNFGVSEGWRNQFYVRSVSTGGLASNWVGPVRTQIGHTEQGYWATENRTQGWDSGHIGGWRGQNEPFWWGVGSNVTLNALHWRNMYTPQSNIITPTGSRTVNWVFFGNDYGPMNAQIGTITSGPGSWGEWGDWSVGGNVGNGSAWGIIPRGSGWSTTGNAYYMLGCGEIWLDGVETYQVSVYYVTRNYVGNSYW